MQDWRLIQKTNFTSLHSLAEFLKWDLPLLQKALPKSHFPLNLPYRLAEKIQKNTLNDPILKQFLPSVEELNKRPGFIKDPVQDESFRKEKKLLQKYKGRALLLSTSACVMNCRFCFRRNFEYEVEKKGFTEELEAIKSDPSLHEVILSGGDPLSLGDKALFGLMDAIADIPHIKTLRFHTRFPIGIPERISDALIEKFESYPIQITFIIHINHVSELDKDVLASLKRIQKTGTPVLTQTVLLKGVNDTAEDLYALFLALINQGILPYYLHQLDKVDGAAHFEVEETMGFAILEKLKALLPGYAVPKYVREIPGEVSKTELTSSQQFLIPAC